MARRIPVDAAWKECLQDLRCLKVLDIAIK